MVCEHVEYTIEPETLIAHEVRLARTRKLANHIVPNRFPCLHDHQFNRAFNERATCIHTYTHVRQRIMMYAYCQQCHNIVDITALSNYKKLKEPHFKDLLRGS